MNKVSCFILQLLIRCSHKVLFSTLELFGALVRKILEVNLATFPLDSTVTSDITRNGDVFDEG